MVEPRLKAEQLAKILGVSENYVARMLARFRDSGIEIEYDFKKGSYVGRIEQQLENSIVGPFAKKLKREIAKAEFSKPPIKFVRTLDRYTVAQFAEFMGVTTANIYNQLNGSKGQKFAAGWVAYQVAPRASYQITRAEVGRDGKFVVPKDIKATAHMYILGEGSQLTGKALQGLCRFPDCEKPEMARGLCDTHYYQARKHPERFKGIIDPKKKTSPSSETKLGSPKTTRKVSARKQPKKSTSKPKSIQPPLEETG
jgi:hypothetical protein